MSVTAVQSTPIVHLSMPISNRKYSYFIPTVGTKVVACAAVLIALANIPGAEAGGSAFMQYVQGCVNGSPSPWAHLICGTICTPLFFAPS
ncbi:MAG: hypothetical protein P0S96_08235 [Simkaniaceae bacterium]|nr:hypothetical protein [Candidatus Sacchlamyda saccharinae]